ncbi:hypothetical protein D9M71_667350 [compost metagenome]
MPSTGQSPELAAAFEHSSGFQLVARDLSQIPVELQHLTGLHNLVAVGDHRQRGLSIGAIQHLLFRERVNRSKSTDALGFEMHWAVLNLPVHTRFPLPDFEGLFGGEATAQAMPRRGANVSHLFNKMSHGNDS